MANLRTALSEMWRQGEGSQGYIRTKFSDLAAIVSSFVAILATLALSALADAAPMGKVLGWMGIHNAPVLDTILRSVSILVSVLLSWLVFTWMIARLPREPVNYASSVRAALIAAIGFELFKLVASIYLKSVLRSPAGATFGPVLGLMVFAYITARLLLFATAWAATSTENSARGVGGTACASGHHHPGAAQRRSQSATGVDRCGSGRRWGTWSFPTAPT